jgi:uncharacterized protein
MRSCTSTMATEARALVVADEAPPQEPAQLVYSNSPDLVVTLGDLPREWLLGLRDLALPRIGVRGNHDDYQLDEAGVTDLHLGRIELGGRSFAGFEGCVRYSQGPRQYTQEEAEGLLRGLPAADVLLCHCPPAGVNDEPDDPAHQGFEALRDWVELNRPSHLLHGHTTPDPRRRTSRLGETAVTWVRAARIVVL